jgi:hypothetical protein
MSDTQINAAGVPLTLIGTPSKTGGPVEIDWSGVPAGIGGKTYTATAIAAMDATARQALLDQLIAKYDGVTVDEGNGTTVGSFEFSLAPADLAVYEQLTSLGVTPTPAIPTSTSAVAAPAITVDDLTPAVPAPSTEAETHVLVPNDHVSLLHRLADDIERGVEGAEALFMSAFRHVFPRAAA